MSRRQDGLDPIPGPTARAPGRRCRTPRRVVGAPWCGVRRGRATRRGVRIWSSRVSGPVSIISHADIPVVLALDHVKDSADQPEVRERLRKLSRWLPLCASISSACSSRGPPVIATWRKACAPSCTPLSRTTLRPARRADREGSLLAAVEAVVSLLHAVAQDQPVDRQLVPDGQHSRADARAVGRQEARCSRPGTRDSLAEGANWPPREARRPSRRCRRATA